MASHHLPAGSGYTEMASAAATFAVIGDFANPIHEESDIVTNFMEELAIMEQIIQEIKSGT